MSKLSLENVQRQFVRSITFLSDAKFEDAIMGGGTLSQKEALGVYQQAYPARLTEALGEIYECCWRVLGDQNFFDLCRSFINQTASQSYNLSDYGMGFPAFLKISSFMVQAPYLFDLALFEQNFHELFHLRPNNGLKPNALAALVQPEKCFRFGQAIKLLAFSNHVYDIWRRDRSDNSVIKNSDWQGEEYLLLYKKSGNQIFVQVFDNSQYKVMSKLMSGKNLSQSFDDATDMNEEKTKELFHFLAEAEIIEEVL